MLRCEFLIHHRHLFAAANRIVGFSTTCVMVADFGVACGLRVDEAQLNETGVVVGTPAYMSPEQATAGRDLDGRSDIYELGCVLNEMLAGHPPFTGTNHRELLARHALDPLPPLRRARPAVPDTVEHAITKALAKVPADRFPTAVEFAQALGTLAAPSVPGPIFTSASPAHAFGTRNMFDGARRRTMRA